MFGYNRSIAAVNILSPGAPIRDSLYNRNEVSVTEVSIAQAANSET